LSIKWHNEGLRVAAEVNKASVVEAMALHPMQTPSGERVENPAFDNQADAVWGFEEARARLDLANGTWRGNGAAALGCPLPEEIGMTHPTLISLWFGPGWDPSG
jgi:hypothetical protein